MEVAVDADLAVVADLAVDAVLFFVVREIDASAPPAPAAVMRQGCLFEAANSVYESQALGFSDVSLTKEVRDSAGFLLPNEMIDWVLTKKVKTYFQFLLRLAAESVLRDLQIENILISSNLSCVHLKL